MGGGVADWHNERDVSRSFMTVSPWPMGNHGGGCMYRIVTGVTSDVNVPSTYLVGSDNGLSPVWRQAITCTNAGILLGGPEGTSFSKILITIHAFSFKKMPLKMAFEKWHPGGDELMLSDPSTLLTWTSSCWDYATSAVQSRKSWVA